MIDNILIVPAFLVLITFAYAAYYDFRFHQVSFSLWFPMLIGSIPFILYWYFNLHRTYPDIFFLTVPIILILCTIYYLLGRFHAMGGADVMGLIFLTVCLPSYPITPIIGNTGHEIFPLSVAINSVILGLILIPVLYTFKDDDQETSDRGIPFMVPIFGAILTAIIFGDFMVMIFKFLNPFF